MRTETAQRLIVASYILALAMPPLGLALALLVALRLGPPHSRHAKWIALLCVAAGALWAMIIAGGALNTTNTGY